VADPQAVIASSRDAVSAFVDAARAVQPAQWTTPRAPGKWSPGQVTEHVVLAYEQSRRMLQGTFTGQARPWYQQLLARWLGLPRLLKQGFGDGAFKAPDFIQPSESPSSRDVLLKRLEVISHDLEEDLARAAEPQRATVHHPVFGLLSLADLVQFMSIHTNHHRPQLLATN
jgi:hypothetical protein